MFQSHVMEDLIAKVHDGVARRISEMEQHGAMTTVGGLKRRLQDLQSQSSRLANAIASTDQMEVLVAQLKAVEAERKAVEAQIAAHRPVNISVTDHQIRQHVTKALMSLRTLLDGDNVLAARAALQKHIPQLVLTPVEREGKPVALDH